MDRLPMMPQDVSTDTTSQEQALAAAAEFLRAGNPGPAREFCQAVLRVAPRNPVALHLLGIAAANQGDVQGAIAWIRRAIDAWPHDVNFHANLGMILRGAGRIQEAAEAYRNATALAPQRLDLHFSLGNMLRQLDLYEEAAKAFELALQLDPNHAGALNNLGLCCQRLARNMDACTCFERLLQQTPGDGAAWLNLGNIRREIGRPDQALDAYRQALAFLPREARVHAAIGTLLLEMRRPSEAMGHLRTALELDAAMLNAALALPLALRECGHLDAALDACQDLLTRWPASTQALVTFATLLRDAGRSPESVDALRRARDLDPFNSAVHGNLIFCMMFDPRVTDGEMRLELERWNRRFGIPPPRITSYPRAGTTPERLRIGYVSPDFCEHVVARNLLPLFRCHNRREFEIFCYSNAAVEDARTAEFRRLSDHFVDISRESDDVLAARIAGDGIDVLIDLSLHTNGTRLEVFARSPAPVQASFAGYPGTTGLNTIGYRLTDAFLEPPGESVDDAGAIRLTSFWCFDPLEEAPEPGELPASVNGRVTFGCLNNLCKINEEVLALWARLLIVVPDSRLVLLAAEGRHRQDIIDTLARAGVRDAAERLTFHPRRPLGAFRQLFQTIDVALDTFPYNGHTTSLEGLYMGVPIVTLAGSTPVARAGLSQLSNLGMLELIAYTPGEFVRIAADLAGNLPRLKVLRSTLRDTMRRSPLMDAPGFAREIERAYRTMWNSRKSR